MSMRMSELFGKDIYDGFGARRGKVYDLIINVEKGTIESITLEPLKARTKAEAKKIISEKSIPYKKVISVKEIVLIEGKKLMKHEDLEETHKRHHRRGISSIRR